MSHRCTCFCPPVCADYLNEQPTYKHFWIAKCPEDQKPYDVVLIYKPLPEFKDEYFEVMEVIPTGPKPNDE